MTPSERRRRSSLKRVSKRELKRELNAFECILNAFQVTELELLRTRLAILEGEPQQREPRPRQTERCDFKLVPMPEASPASESGSTAAEDKK